MTRRKFLPSKLMFVSRRLNTAITLRPDESLPWSVLMASVTTRVAGASVVVLVLWLAVVWALADPTS